MDCINSILCANTALSQNTKKAYNSSYNKLIESGRFKRRISNTANDKIIESLHKLTTNPNTFAMYLNVVILLKRHFCKDDTLLVKYRNTDHRIAIDNRRTESNDILAEGLPSLDELKKYTDGLYKNSQWLSYIINFLLLELNCRNTDICLVVTYNKDNITPNENYALVRQNDIVIVRQRYKTFKTHGVKKNILRSRKLYKAFKALELNESDFLLKNPSGDRATEEGVGGIIQGHTFEGAGSGVYFKSAVKHADGQYNKLEKLSKNRGTNIATVVKNYTV